MMFRALRPEEVEVRVGACNEKCCTLLLYKTSRTDMALLDEVIGPERWQCDYKSIDGKLFCGIGVDVDRNWIWKWDTGVESNMEAQKGEASDAFKRAGFKWGIGRELYTAPEIKVWSDKCTIKEGKNGKKQCYDDFRVTELEVYDGRISRLTVRNMSRKGLVVYGNARQDAPDAHEGPVAAEEAPESQERPKGRFAKALALKAEAVELGISEDGIGGWIAATIGHKTMRDYTDAEVQLLEGYLETLIADKRALDG